MAHSNIGERRQTVAQLQRYYPFSEKRFSCFRESSTLQLVMKTELIYIALDDQRLTALAQESEATGCAVEELIRSGGYRVLARAARPRVL